MATLKTLGKDMTNLTGCVVDGDDLRLTAPTMQATVALDATVGNALDQSTAVENVSADMAGSYIDNASPVTVASPDASPASPNFNAEYAFNTTLSLTGSYQLTSYLMAGNVNGRICVDMGASVTLYGVRISNLHDTGGATARGIKNSTIYLSDNAGDFTATYGTDIAMSQAWSGVVSEHTAVDEADWQDISFTQITSGRYLIIEFSDNWGDPSFAGMRRVQLQEGITKPSISYDRTIDAGATSYETVGDLTALKASADTGHQLQNFKLNGTGVIGALVNFFSIDNYSADVIPPADPTGARGISSEVWAMWWEQSPEGSDIVAHLRRDVSGVIWYLAKVGGMPVWVDSLPAEFWTFSRGSATADNKSNAWEEDNILVGFEGYYARFRDLSDNDSAWTLVSAIDPGSKPDALTSLTVLSVGDGTVTIAVVTPNPTDKVFLRMRNATDGEGWGAESVTHDREGSGNIVVTSLTNKDLYGFSGYINNGSCDSDWATPVPARPVSSVGLGGSIMGLYLSELKTLIEASDIFKWIGYSLDDIPTAYHPACVIVCDEDPEPAGEETNASVAKIFTFKLIVDIRSRQKPTEEILIIREQVSTILRDHRFTVEGHYDTDLESGEIEEPNRQGGLFVHRSHLILKCYARVAR